MNIYSDPAQLALKYLKDAEVVTNNVLIMIGDFNIYDSFWDSNYSYHSTHSDLLIDIADSIHLSLSFPLNLFLLGTQTIIITQNWSLI